MIRFLYNHNPFYLISAALILYGCAIAQQDPTQLLDRVWFLIGSLCGYSLALAVTAVAIVRWGKVWEDARSIVLVLILMFLALAVSLDQLCNNMPSVAPAVLCLGLAFCVAITEGLIRSLQVQFPWSYRGPFYAVVALMFLFPLGVSPVLTELSNNATAWGILLFPCLCGLAFLGLIPAVRQGSVAVRKNGTPWSWPWYPWTVFFFVALMASMRCYVLTLSYQAVAGLESSFSGYYLVPLLGAILFVALEIALVERASRLRRQVLCVAPLLMLLALPIGGSAPFHRMLAEVVATVGSPLWITLIGLVVFYAYAGLRGVQGVEWGLVFCLLAATRIGPQTTGWHSLADLQWWPMAVLASGLLTSAIWKREAIRYLVASFSIGGLAYVLGSESWSPPVGLAIGYHVLIACWLAAAGWFEPPWSQRLQQWSVALLSFAALVVLVEFESSRLSLFPAAGYFGTLGAGAVVWWIRQRKPWWLLASGIYAGSLTLTALSVLYRHGQNTLGARVVIPVFLGLASFGAAVFISGLKGGLAKRLARRWRGFLQQFTT